MIERPDAVNWSTLRYMRQSPKHYRYALAHPQPDTEALLLGRLVHCAVYEPDKLAARYVREPNFHRGMNDDTARDKGYDGGKQAAAAWNVNGRDSVPPAIWERHVAIAAALTSDPIAGPMIRGGFSEQLVTWTDSATGIECRGRVDHVNGCLSDLKTARSVDPRLFVAQAIRLGYHGQIAYYADGLAANGIALVEPPCWIVAENEPPYDVVVWEIPDALLRAGRALYRRCLSSLALCRAADAWPGVSGGARCTIEPPAWAVEQPGAALTMGGEAIEF